MSQLIDELNSRIASLDGEVDYHRSRSVDLTLQAQQADDNANAAQVLATAYREAVALLAPGESLEAPSSEPAPEEFVSE
jgi:hypothetical protein